MKKLLIILVLLLCVGFFVGDYINSPMKISYNGETLNAESPIKEDEDYLIPAKSVIQEIFDTEAEYNIYNKYVIAEVDGKEFVITAGSDTLLIDNKEVQFSLPSVIENNVLYMPAEYLEAFDLEYKVNIITKTFEINN